MQGRSVSCASQPGARCRSVLFRPLPAHLGPRPRPDDRGGSCGLIVVLLAASCCATPALGQEFGQWSWEAFVGLGGRSNSTSRDGSGGSTFRENNLAVGFGLNGFIAHPAVSRFRLGGEYQFIETGAGESLDTDRVGLRGDFEFFPRGPYRGSLYFNRELYDYAGRALDDALTLSGAPDVLTSYGGRFRAARGPFRGSLLGIDRSTIDFLEASTDEQIRNVEFYDWSRVIGRFSHHLRLEHRLRDLGTVDQNLEEYRVNLDENGDFSPDWHWSLTASGVAQEIETFGTLQNGLDDYQLRSRLTHDVREQDLLELFYVFGLTRSDTQPSSQSHGMSATYRWQVGPLWQVGPFVSYSRISSDPESVQSPRAGILLAWNWSREEWNSAVTARGSYGDVDRSMPGATQDEDQLGGSLVGTLGHGTMKGLRKELEVEVIRNRLRITQSEFLDFPGIGLPIPGLGTEDLRRARVMLGHQWDSQFLNAWLDWTRRDTKEIVSAEDLVTETLTATAQYGSSAFDLKASYADSKVAQGVDDDQSVRSVGVAASWRPWRTVSLRASYRQDRRDLVLAPDTEGTTYEAGFRWQLGQFFLDAAYLENTQRLLGAPETTIRSVTWSVSRRFGGLLPIVTGPQRRGVIR